jgi:hypothetical protein
VALWHCSKCRREFEAPAGTVSFFHRCVIEKRARVPVKLKELPPDQDGRDDLWHGLVSMVHRLGPLLDD